MCCGAGDRRAELEGDRGAEGLYDHGRGKYMAYGPLDMHFQLKPIWPACQLDFAVSSLHLGCMYRAMPGPNARYVGAR